MNALPLSLSSWLKVLNRRLAPQLYRGVVAITRETDGRLAIGGNGEPVEWAVEMARFDENRTLDHLAHQIDDDLADALGRAVADAHRTAPVVDDTVGYESSPPVFEDVSTPLALLNEAVALLPTRIVFAALPVLIVIGELAATLWITGTAPRDIIIGPNLWDLDASLLKDFKVTKVSENFTVQFRAEAFNILNHPSFQLLATNTQIFAGTSVNASAGKLQATNSSPRQLQLALKIIF